MSAQQYYSKTPKQVREELEKKDFKGSKKRKISRIILLFDLLVIIVIFYIYFNNKEKRIDTNHSNTVVQIQKDVINKLNKKKFQFNEILIASDCQALLKCSVSLKSDKLLHNFVDKIVFEMKDIKRNEIIFINQKEIEKMNTQKYIFNLPEKLSYTHSVYILLKKDENILTRFRAYP